MNVYDKLQAQAYVNHNPLPERPCKPMLHKHATPDQIRAHAHSLECYDELMNKYRCEWATYNAHSVELEEQFRHDLEVYHDMVGHAKADLLYGKAYEMGHHGGMQEVANYYSDLVELVK